MVEYLLLAVVTVVAFVFVVQPLLAGMSVAPADVPGHIVDLQARRQYLFQAIRDVDSDFEQGKVTDAEYEDTRSRFIREAAVVMSQLERETGHTDEQFTMELAQLRARARAERRRASAEDEKTTT